MSEHEKHFVQDAHSPRAIFTPDLGCAECWTLMSVMNEPLHEWPCPNCGATTRARMADGPPAPIDWPARFRAAAEAARREGFDVLAAHLGEASDHLRLPCRVEAVGRALLGQNESELCAIRDRLRKVVENEGLDALVSVRFALGAWGEP